MTLKEALLELSKKDAARSYAAGKVEWIHRGGGETCEYNLSILPGIDGSNCQSVSHSRLEVALQHALDLFPVQTPDENQE